MESNIFLLAGLLVVIVLLGIIGVLSRYRKCKSDEVLVVYGKTGDRSRRSSTTAELPSCGLSSRATTSSR